MFLYLKAYMKYLAYSKYNIFSVIKKHRSFYIKKFSREYAINSSSYNLESPFGPVEIPKQPLPEYIFKDIGQWIDKPMITCGITGRTYKYGEGLFMIKQFATSLLNEVGLNKGDVLGILAPNIPEYVFVIHGALQAGLVVTFVNPLYTQEEIKMQFDNSGVKCCVTIPNFLKLSIDIGLTLKNYKGSIVIGGKHDKTKNVFEFKQIISKPMDYELPDIEPHQVALLPYSSGTTGLPKGVMLSHNNCTVNLEQCNHPDFVNHIPTSDNNQEIILSVLPFFHIYGFNSVLNVAMMYGIHMIVIPKFTPKFFIECLIKYKPSILFVVPSLLLFLATHPEVTPNHLLSIKEITCGAAPASKKLIDNLKQKVKRDIVIRQGYGMTETSPCILFTRYNAPNSKLESAGQLVRGTKARIVSLTTGENLPLNQSGELYVKGPQVMLGYLENENATKETIDKEGWLHTGDIAYYDEDQYFYIVGRSKELIKVKGHQVSPTELENIIIQIPEVDDVAVVGVPDISKGEIPRAFVVKKLGVDISEKDIIDFVETKVAPYKKISGGVKFIQNIPRNHSGKIIRKELK